MKKIFTTFLVGLLTILIGCVRMAVEKTLVFPAGEYTQVDWLSELKPVVFIRDEHDNILGIQPHQPLPKLYVDLNDLPQDLDCGNGVEYAFHGMLPDGRLQLVERCKPSTYAAYEQDSYLLAYNTVTRKVERLVEEPLKHKWAGNFSWNPQMTLGVYQVGGSLVGADIYWLTREKTIPMNVAVGEGHRSWVLSKNYPQFSTDQGVAAYPTWSPDGTTIAFFASIDAIGKAGQIRSDSEFRLYLMDPMEQSPKVALDNVYHPFNLVWSPDNKWLTFIGEYGTLRRYGIWLFSISDRKIRLLDTGDFRDIAWSPDSNRILTSLCVKKLQCNREEIWEYNINSIGTQR